MLIGYVLQPSEYDGCLSLAVTFLVYTYAHNLTDGYGADRVLVIFQQVLCVGLAAYQQRHLV